MIVLVIGRDGQLARSLAELNPHNGIIIVTRGRPAVDLLEPTSVTKILDVIRPDVVVNAAAYTAVDKAESETDLAYAVNAEGVRHLGAAAAAREIPVIHISTDYVYAGSKALPYVESDPVGPLSVYGHSKLAGEQMLAEANPQHIILRTAWLHSPFGQNFVRSMLRLGKTREEISVVDDQHGNPTYASHLARAIAAISQQLAAARSCRKWGIYHAAGSGETTRFGLAQEIFKAAALRGVRTPRLRAISTGSYPTPARRPANSRLNTFKLEEKFGITLPHWSEGVTECVARLVASANAELRGL